ncbi:S8 family serine peptidase [Staphylococcus sp. GDY8P199P]|uniref:S8 family serine peptidase n=1 Tax=Staphylococcus sp. GDY8P199P TaxID=2804175 RepID=UPI001AEC3F0C|nr:S8 family serine peptidase [Staphylococcus sp. GDY8P199P]
MNKYLIVFREAPTESLFEKINVKNIRFYKNLPNIVTCYLSENQYLELKRNSEIKSIELDKSDVMQGETTQNNQKQSYAVDLTEARKFHKEGITGKGIKVAIVDSGVQNHEDLNLSGGYNAYDENVPYNHNLAINHGTKVAGAVAMQDNDKGMVGIAPGVSLYAVRIDDGKGTINRTIWSAQIKAIDWCIENGMDAINCSFSSSTDSLARREAFEHAYNEGIAIFCSAGNSQPLYDNESSTIAFPSKYPFVVTTANINSDKTRYVTSSIGRGINFSNGGVSVNLTDIDNNVDISSKYQVGTGTSYASPITMGMYALYKEKYGESRDKILQRMYVNSEKIGDERLFGAGIPKYPEIDYFNTQMKG